MTKFQSLLFAQTYAIQEFYSKLQDLRGGTHLHGLCGANPFSIHVQIESDIGVHDRNASKTMEKRLKL